jgi:hypothetical protein
LKEFVNEAMKQKKNMKKEKKGDVHDSVNYFIRSLRHHQTRTTSKQQSHSQQHKWSSSV